ncbi:MAG TPA: SCP2 sterol-binding domain-containing protein [Acidimicrobiales bacterium]|nr:SCP2 sterol-binding domain-containing protein [Acidimicrobiales bacterium]
MARYLSAEWFDDLNAAARQLPDPAPGPAPAVAGRLNLQQVVTDSPDGEVRYWVRLDHGRVTAGLGETESPDAVISQSYDTAVGVVTGAIRVQTALMSGEIRLTGNVAALIENQEALRGLNAAFSDLRDRTSY